MQKFAKTIYAIQHLAFEDLGSLEDLFYQKGYRIRYFEAGVDDLSKAFNYDGLTIILGGPIGVNDVEDYPFLQQEIDLLKKRLEENKPTLGICLGAQLIAKALGANVYAGSIKEIGWSTLTLPQLDDNILSPLLNIPVLHWHGDTFELPQNVQHLASSAHYANQAFQFKNTLALQFHLEVDDEHLEKWLIGHHCELKQANIDIKHLRTENERYASELMEAAKIVIYNYLKQIDLS